MQSYIMRTDQIGRICRLIYVFVGHMSEDMFSHIVADML